MKRNYPSDERCQTCDGRYCGDGYCKGRDGYVWVNGHGWRSPNVARAAQNLNPTIRVQWDDVWTPERFGLALGLVPRGSR